MSQFPYITENEVRSKTVDIVFSGIRFTILKGSKLNSRYKTGQQIQGGTNSGDSGITKERTVFPATIILDKLKKEESMERFIFQLQFRKTKGSLYIYENKALLKNMFISSIIRSYDSGNLIHIDVEFTEEVTGGEVLFNDSLSTPGGRKQKKNLSKDVNISEDIWADIGTIPR